MAIANQHKERLREIIYEHAGFQVRLNRVNVNNLLDDLLQRNQDLTPTQVTLLEMQAGRLTWIAALNKIDVIQNKKGENR